MDEAFEKWWDDNTGISTTSFHYLTPREKKLMYMAWKAGRATFAQEPDIKFYLEEQSKERSMR